MKKKDTSSMIAKRFNQLILSTILADLLIAVIGVVMMLVPEMSNKVIGILMGVAFLFSGASSIYKYFYRDGAKLYSLNLFFGLISIIMGVVVMVYPYSVMRFVTVCLGIYLIAMGALNLNYGRWFKIGNDPSWLITIVIGILLIAFGIIVIINPFADLSVTMVMGMFLLFLAIFQITDAIMLKQRAKEIVKIFW